jgi:hypothetical protein
VTRLPFFLYSEWEESVSIRTAARWFYVILIPLVMMLFFALSGYDHMVQAPDITAGGGWASSSTDKISYRLGDSLHNVIIDIIHEGNQGAPVEIDLRARIERLLLDYGSARACSPFGYFVNFSR